MQGKTPIVSGSTVVLNEEFAGAGLRKIQCGTIYKTEKIEIDPLQTLLPSNYISRGYIPDQYKPHLIKGIGTTNHDLMGSDRFVFVNGERYSAAWFRQATAGEVNQKARSIL